MSQSHFRVSGKKFDLSVGEPTSRASKEGQWKLTSRPGGWIVAESPQGETRRIAVLEERSKLSVSVGGRLLHGEIQTQERGAPAGGGGAQDLVAQFPGKVRKILVAPGAQVKTGDPLVLVEAMKMEFAVQAPVDGRVKRVLVQEGQQLSPGDRFVELESSLATDSEPASNGEPNANG